MFTKTLLAAIAQHTNIHVAVPSRTGLNYVQVTPEAARGLVTAVGDNELHCLPLNGILYIAPAVEGPAARFTDGQHTSFGQLPLGSTFRFLPAGTYSYTKVSSTEAKRAGRPNAEVTANRAVAYVG